MSAAACVRVGSASPCRGTTGGTRAPGVPQSSDPGPPGVVGSAAWCAHPPERAPVSPQAARVQEQERREAAQRLQEAEERRRLQEAELRRVEEEKERALGLQRRERELRQRLLSILLSRRPDDPRAHDPLAGAHADLLQPVLDILHTVSAGAAPPRAPAGPAPPSAPKASPPRPDAEPSPHNVNGGLAEDAARPGAPDGASPEKRCPAVLSCIPDNQQQPKGAPAEQSAPRKDARSEQDKCNREPSRGRSSADRSDRRPRREGSWEDARVARKERRSPRRRAPQDAGAEHARARRSPSRERSGRRDRSRERRAGSGRRCSRHRRSGRSRSGSPGRRHSSWNR